MFVELYVYSIIIFAKLAFFFLNKEKDKQQKIKIKMA
jgi:hypothetical protein